MAAGVLELMGERVVGGVITVPDGLGRPLRGIDVWEAAHPVPDARGLAGAAEALAFARSAGRDDLVLCVLSGGASSLWPAPPDGVTLGDLREVTGRLLAAGAPINDINTVRRHLSRIAGGGLARAADPARVLTLAISDVVSGPAHAIGSGPTLPDPSTYADALGVLSRWEVAPPAAVRRHLQAGVAGEVPETLKPGEPGSAAPFHVIASLREALAAAAEEAARLGYASAVVDDRIEGPARDAGQAIGRAVLAAREAGGRRALVWGGETTVVVKGAGRGGRNQELALAAARVLQDRPGIALASFATDGIDGPTSAAGALIDGGTIGRAAERGHDPDAALEDNDSCTFLGAAGDLVVTGPTGTNVNDVVVALIE